MNEGRRQPFILGMICAAIKSARAAKKILEEKRNLSEEELAYYRHVIEDGERAKKMLRNILGEKKAEGIIEKIEKSHKSC